MSDTFLDLVLQGEALWTDIDDYVDRWHDGDEEAPLATFLGFAQDEYALWTEQPQALRLIIAARKRDVPVLDLIESVHDYGLAARGGLSEAEARAVQKWLKETGRLPSN